MLSLATSARDDIVDHARSGAPDEVCGVLAGERGAGSDDGTDHVHAVRRTANAAADPRTRYRLDPEELLAAVDAVEAAGRDVVGFYHSHPRGPAEPSGVDADRATWTGYVYLVASLAGSGPALAAWRWTGEGFQREAVRVVEAGTTRHGDGGQCSD